MRDKEQIYERAEHIAYTMESKGIDIDEVEEFANIYMNLGATMTTWALVNAGIIQVDEIEDLEALIQEMLTEVSEGD